MIIITCFGDQTCGTFFVDVFNSVTSPCVLSYRCVLHYFLTMPVGGIKIVTVYKRSIFQVEWLIATLILMARRICPLIRFVWDFVFKLDTNFL